MESTTFEIIEQMERISLDTQSIEKLRLMLVQSDFVKFAKGNPLPDENSSVINLAYDFVGLTKQEILVERSEESNHEGN